MSEVPALQSILSQLWQDMRLLLPELLVAGGLLSVLLADLLLLRKPRLKHWLLPLLALAFLLAAGLSLIDMGWTPVAQSALSRMWWHDNWSLAVRALAVGGTAASILDRKSVV